MFERVLIANRGEIACRISRTLRKLGVQPIAVYSEADRHSRHVLEAAHAVCIGPAPAKESYLNSERVLSAALESRAQAIHPGYGFLSENAAFAEACEARGVAFIGPTPTQMRAFGLKHSARELAARAEVPLLPGTGLLRDVAHALAEARRIGFPLMLKSSAGGGGIGMQLVRDEAELASAFEAVQRLSRNNFGDASVFLERFVARARHLEVQLFGDGHGTVVALGERDCSAQRRNQKVVEETPAPGLAPKLRAALLDAALRLGQSVNYRSAGTVEFVFDADRNEFYFLEVNTRLQVEHGVTEAVTGVDLVEWMVRTAAGDPPDLSAPLAPSGHAIEVRVYAEDPAREFKPSAGLLTEVEFPADVRVDTWVERGTEVSPFYDPMLAKVIVHATTRDEAVRRLASALAATRLGGIETNTMYLRKLCKSSEFSRGTVLTSTLRQFEFKAPSLEVVSPGTFSMVVDYPGRLGYWDVGVPPSGPMDSLSHRLANRAVGNDERAATLELTMSGPTLRFATDACIALVGAEMKTELDGVPVSFGAPLEVRAGQTLKMGAVIGAGARAYLAVRGGFDVPLYLGSRTTFTLGGFGGHGGRTLRRGDVLHIGTSVTHAVPSAVPASALPTLERRWEIGVLYGPHAAPDFFTPRDIEMFFGTDWEVHYNSNRTGVRLVGPKPEWARSDGGEAGLHPSNIHDVPYAIGAVDFTGDMPIVLGPDGPSLGGFVCPATIVAAELWKIGQLRPSDRVRFVPIAPEAAAELEREQNETIATLRLRSRALSAVQPQNAVISELEETKDRVRVAYRRAGDKNLLVEYGPLVLDLRLRFRVDALMSWIRENKLPGIVDLTPGIRSLQIHFDSALVSSERLLDALRRAESELPAIDQVEVPTRIVRLPLSWDDPATRLAIEKYTTSVRPDAPWCPSNIEFIRRINGLDSLEQVHRIVFGASYLVLGLGDVYLGAPVATPVDPRHRLVTTKYNPARTWTPENAVGIGGAYLCIYGMEGPGGYQFVGRTLQVYNRFRNTPLFAPGSPWLLRFFDQIQFYPVSAAELLDMREGFLHGKVELDVRHDKFRLRDYERFLADNRASIEGFKATQQAAFDAERQRWIESGQLGFSEAERAAGSTERAEGSVPAGAQVVESHVPGSVWKLMVERGERVRKGDALLVVESMKMEVCVEAPEDGTVLELLVSEGKAVSPGQQVAFLRPEAP
jgi:urea carboxylase